MAETQQPKTVEQPPKEAPTIEEIPEEYRYVFGCPECGAVWKRKRDSEIVKGVRRKVRVCNDCEERLAMWRDNRPDPPICPKCGEVALYVKEHTNLKRFVHHIEVGEYIGLTYPDTESCLVRADD